jgi:hypothetical protein
MWRLTMAREIRSLRAATEKFFVWPLTINVSMALRRFMRVNYPAQA